MPIEKWHGFLATDLSLDASQIVGYYSRRWAIEVFFKDAKQMLYLGKNRAKHLMLQLPAIA